MICETNGDFDLFIEYEHTEDRVNRYTHENVLPKWVNPAISKSETSS